MLHPTLVHRKAHLKHTLEEEEEEAVVALVEALMEGGNPQHSDHTASNMAMPMKTKRGTTCNYMIENEYEERFLNARSPCMIDGYVGSTKNV